MFSFYLLLLSIILLTSCNKEIEREYNKLYIDSFDYEVTKNEEASSNSYLLSYDIDFSTKKTSSIRGRSLRVRITGLQNTTSVYSLDYCNTENVRVYQSDENFHAIVTYIIEPKATTMKASGTLSISTTHFIEDINDYVKIESYCDIEVIDYNQLMEQEVFRMNYSDEISADNIIYSFDEWTESYKIVSIYTMSNDLQIPNYYNNYPVQTIDQAAFKQVINIEKLVLPKTLTSIPKGLLTGMLNLKSLSLPFIGSKSNDANSYIGYLFDGSSSNENINVVPRSLEEVEITGTTTIKKDAFYGCSGIKRIVLNDEITDIGDFAFSNCRNLESIELSKNLTDIGKMAFYGCSMTSIVLPNTIKSIGESAFYQCSQLTEVFYRGTEAEWYNISFVNEQLEMDAATKYFYADTKPNDAGHYWHYVDGVVTKW